MTESRLPYWADGSPVWRLYAATLLAKANGDLLDSAHVLAIDAAGATREARQIFEERHGRLFTIDMGRGAYVRVRGLKRPGPELELRL